MSTRDTRQLAERCQRISQRPVAPVIEEFVEKAEQGMLYGDSFFGMPAEPIRTLEMQKESVIEANDDGIVILPDDFLALEGISLDVVGYHTEYQPFQDIQQRRLSGLTGESYRLTGLVHPAAYTIVGNTLVFSREQIETADDRNISVRILFYAKFPSLIGHEGDGYANFIAETADELYENAVLARVYSEARNELDARRVWTKYSSQIEVFNEHRGKKKIRRRSNVHLPINPPGGPYGGPGFPSQV